MTFAPGDLDYIAKLNAFSAGGSLSYATGTFTPALAGSTTAGTGTYSSRSGNHTKIGNRVFFQLAIVVSAHTGTGGMVLSGLPYPASANVNTMIHAYVSDTSFSGPIVGQVVSNTATVTLPDLKMSSALFTPTFTLLVSGSYQTDS